MKDSLPSFSRIEFLPAGYDVISDIIDMNIKQIVNNFLRVDIATIQARIRNKYGIVDSSNCDHHEWDVARNVCMLCGITKMESLSKGSMNASSFKKEK